MRSNQRISFHESTIVSIRRGGNAVTMELEGVHVDNNTQKATIRLTGIRGITRDGTLVDDLGLEYEDGEILTLEHTPNSLHVIVEWNDFKKHHSVTRSYRITCDSLAVDIP